MTLLAFIIVLLGLAVAVVGEMDRDPVFAVGGAALCVAAILLWVAGMAL